MTIPDFTPGTVPPMVDPIPPMPGQDPQPTPPDTEPNLPPAEIPPAAPPGEVPLPGYDPVPKPDGNDTPDPVPGEQQPPLFER